MVGQLFAKTLSFFRRTRVRLDRNVQRFRGGLVFKAYRLCVSLNSRLESNKEEEEGSVLEPSLSLAEEIRYT